MTYPVLFSYDLLLILKAVIIAINFQLEFLLAEKNGSIRSIIDLISA